MGLTRGGGETLNVGTHVQNGGTGSTARPAASSGFRGGSTGLDVMGCRDLRMRGPMIINPIPTTIMTHKATNQGLLVNRDIFNTLIGADRPLLIVCDADSDPCVSGTVCACVSGIVCA